MIVIDDEWGTLHQVPPPRADKVLILLDDDSDGGDRDPIIIDDDLGIGIITWNLARPRSLGGCAQLCAQNT